MSTVRDGAVAEGAGRGARGRSLLARGSFLPLRLAGAGLLIAAAAVHLDLYLTGYRTIPTIGWLFLLQVVTGFALAALVLAVPAQRPPGRLIAAAGAGFALCTLAGYLVAVQVGLFGFREVRTAAGIVSGLVDVAAFAVLAAFAVDAADAAQAPRRRGVALTAVACVSVLALGLLAGALTGAGGSASQPGAASLPGAPAGGAELRTATIGGIVVLTNAAGRTLYWFGPDTATKSACTGSCAAYWPPVSGPLTAGPGVTGRLGTIRRGGGSLQETYDGHPLYTYVGDSGPGQAHGNGISLNGGLWHEVTAGG